MCDYSLKRVKVLEFSETYRNNNEKNKDCADDTAICAGLRTSDGKDGPAIRLTDGSRGVKYETETGMQGVCMPSPCALGSSFDRELVRKIGKAVGSMALSGGYNAVRSPDAGVVRSPLYGGLADCFGEDPYLNGAMAAEWVKGVQSVGAAAVLGHFAGGRQSGGKYSCDSVIDKRALHEIYLSPYQTAVRLSQPRAVECGCNRINGLECAENAVLLTEILRRDWKSEGVVLTDLRLSDCVASMQSGVDLSVPSGGQAVRRQLRKAIKEDELPEHYPHVCAKRIKEMTEFDDESLTERMSDEECRDLSITAAEQCAVLLKNQKNTLPLPLGGEIALIGRQASVPRIQRGGMHALPVDHVKNILQVFDDNQIRYQYCDGWEENSQFDETLLSQAVQCAAAKEFAVIFAGFDDIHDNSSTDRESNRLPKAQVKLINAVAKANPNTVVVVNGSALPKMNWVGKVKSVLYLPLGGEGTCEALYRLLFGLSTPCGRLSVSYSLGESDMPCSDTFGTSDRVSEFRESIYVGYRYYNKAGIFPAFPFGYGLSYTAFTYSAMRAVKCSQGWEITLDVKNIGTRDGAEIVQLYVEPPKNDRFRPSRELKQFHKVYLGKGEKRSITMLLPREALACYDPELGRFRVNAGRYRLYAGASSNDLRAEVWISVKGEPVPHYEVPDWYIRPAGRPKESDFRALFGKKITDITPYSAQVYSIDCTLHQLSGIGIFALAEKCVKRVMRHILKPTDDQSPEYAERVDEIVNRPIKQLCGRCHGLYPMKLTQCVLWLANRHGGKQT